MFAPILIAVMAQVAGSTEFQFFQPLSPPRRCQVMAHRGQIHQVPENSGKAIDHAVADLIEWIEVDIRRSNDGQHVLLHDATVDRTTNGKGAVSSLTLDELKKLDAGSRFSPRFAGTTIPTLAEALALAKGRINLCLDCKDADAEQLANEIRSAGMENQVAVFGPTELLARVRECSSGTIAIMVRWQPSNDFEKQLDSLRPAMVEIPAELVTAEICGKLHGSGIRIEVDSLGEHDTREFWKRVVDSGADCVQTDLPEEFLAFVHFSRLKERPVQFTLHRGASRYAPENTTPAYEKAFRLGADFVEFDVRTTADGAHFLLHDASLDRTTNGHGPISRQTAAAIRQLDAGAWFSREQTGTSALELGQFLDLTKGHAQFYFDAKAIAPEALAQALESHGVVEQTVVFQGPDYLNRLKKINPAIRVMPPLYRADQIEKLAERVKPYAVDVSWESLSPALIERCHKLGVRVFSDAKQDNIQGHLQAMRYGIDMIQTDHPLQFLRALELFAGKP